MSLTPEQIETLKQLINIGVEQAAEILNSMIPSQVRLQVPMVEPVGSGEEAESLRKSQQVTISLGFSGAFSGSGMLALPFDSASKLTTALTDEDANGPDFDLLRAEVITEVGNIVINGVMGSIGNAVQKEVLYDVPVFADMTALIDEGSSVPDTAKAETTDLMARTRFTVEQLEIEGDIVLSFVANSFGSLLAALDNMMVKIDG